MYFKLASWKTVFFSIALPLNLRITLSEVTALCPCIFILAINFLIPKYDATLSFKVLSMSLSNFSLSDSICHYDFHFCIGVCRADFESSSSA